MRTIPERRFTIVSFHAHPDDEALLTGGTLAQLAAAGHRVVLVVATAGEAGLADSNDRRDADLGGVRLGEVNASARALGVERVVLLGYADSGFPEAAVPRDDVRSRFAEQDVEAVARRLAVVLRDERADVLTTYDAQGGYGHPDHVQVHRAGALAAAEADTSVVLEASYDRTVVARADRWLRRLSLVVPLPRFPEGRDLYLPRSDLTHRIDVRDQWRAKRAALVAHVSQASGGDQVRALALLLRLPGPVFRRVFRYEWFREVGRPTGPALNDDVLQSLRQRSLTEDSPRSAESDGARRRGGTS